MFRIITCQHATLLVEQQAGQPLPRAVRISLWLHLRCCPYCSRYAQQTALIAGWVRAASDDCAAVGPALPAATKERMRRRLGGTG